MQGDSRGVAISHDSFHNDGDGHVVEHEDEEVATIVLTTSVGCHAHYCRPPPCRLATAMHKFLLLKNWTNLFRCNFFHVI